MTAKTEAVAHHDITPSTEIAYKIGSRWYWVTSVEEVLPSGSVFVMTVPAAKDPRYVQANITGKGGAKLRYVSEYDTITMRAQTAPVFDWVTRRIEDRSKMAAFKRGELELTRDEYIALSNRIGF